LDKDTKKYETAHAEWVTADLANDAEERAYATAYAAEDAANRDNTLDKAVKATRRELANKLRRMNAAKARMDAIATKKKYTDAKAKWEPREEQAEETILQTAREALYGAEAVEAAEAIPATSDTEEVPAVEAKEAVEGAVAKLGKARKTWAEAALFLSTAEVKLADNKDKTKVKELVGTINRAMINLANAHKNLERQKEYHRLLETEFQALEEKSINKKTARREREDAAENMELADL